MPEQIFHIILLLIVFIAILWGAQFASKKIAKLQLGKQNSNGMKLIEAIYVSPGKMLQIIQVGERYFLIAVYKEGITFLTELNSEDIKKRSELEEPAESYPFAHYFNQFKKR